MQLGPTDTTKALCQSQFRATTSVWSNSATAASGRQDISFEGANTGQSGTEACDCTCGVYRHWIKGYWRTGSATAAKRHDISSCGHPLTISETALTEEFTSCIGDNDPAPCTWRYADAPGWSSGLAAGTYVELHYEFVYQLWDRCRNRSVAAAGRTLDISGSTSPRTVRWTP